MAVLASMWICTGSKLLAGADTVPDRRTVMVEPFTIAANVTGQIKTDGSGHRAGIRRWADGLNNDSRC